MFDLSSRHTFALNSSASHLLELQHIDQLSIVSDRHQQKVPWLVLGEGSNVLFCDDFDGLLICNQLRGLRLIEVDNAWLLIVAAGENWPQLVSYLVEKEIGGLENLALIPGTVGTAPVQNIGAYGVEFSNFCDWVEVWDVASRQMIKLSAKQCRFGYRDSCFKDLAHRHWIVTRVALRLTKAWKPQLHYGPLQQLSSDTSPKDIFERVCAIRRSKLPDPTQIGNAGSFFKNPVVDSQWLRHYQKQYPGMPVYPLNNGEAKIAAGWLIEQCDLKGHWLGGARVYPNQVLVLINATGRASAEDVLSLANLIRQRVYQQFAVTLVPEVSLIGRHGFVMPEEVLHPLC